MSFEAEAQERPRKRIKKEPKALSYDHENRRLFAPFRALGFVSNHVPFAMQVRTYKGATTAPRVHILTCLGRAWAELEGEKMRLLFVGGLFFQSFSIGNLNFSQSTGPDANEPISALSLHGNYVWATAGPEVLQYETGKQVGSSGPPCHSALLHDAGCSIFESSRHPIICPAQFRKSSFSPHRRRTLPPCLGCGDR